MAEQAPPKMIYRNLGKTGLKVSVISFGNWLNSNSTEALERNKQLVKRAFELGINFFDTAEVSDSFYFIRFMATVRLRSNSENVSRLWALPETALWFQPKSSGDLLEPKTPMTSDCLENTLLKDSKLLSKDSNWTMLTLFFVTDSMKLCN